MEKRMVNQIKEIKMSKEMRTRILKNCVTKIEREKENEDMKKNFVIVYKKPLIVAATLAVCFCLTGITAMAATGKLQGYFKDKTNWNGAITGQTYENATEEINVSTFVENELLSVTVDMVEPNLPPYNEISEIRIEAGQILNKDGNVAVMDIETGKVTIENSKAVFSIPVEKLAEGTYKLVISSFVGEKKAEQPLSIYGNWECEFTK